MKEPGYKKPMGHEKREGPGVKPPVTRKPGMVKDGCKPGKKSY